MITKEYADFSWQQTEQLLSIDSPTGFTNYAAAWVQSSFAVLGFDARITTKGGVLVDLGGSDANDGLLLEALETAPAERRKGYAKALIQAVLPQLGDVKVYSHVNKRNTASRKTHEACGFVKCLDHAVYADGSVLHDSDTYRYGV